MLIFLSCLDVRVSSYGCKQRNKLLNSIHYYIDSPRRSTEGLVNTAHNNKNICIAECN